MDVYESLLRLYVVLTAPPLERGDERGDVPGWVLILSLIHI